MVENILPFNSMNRDNPIVSDNRPVRLSIEEIQQHFPKSKNRHGPKQQ